LFCVSVSPTTWQYLMLLLLDENVCYFSSTLQVVAICHLHSTYRCRFYFHDSRCFRGCC
jgi:hypothetical protein